MATGYLCTKFITTFPRLFELHLKDYNTKIGVKCVYLLKRFLLITDRGREVAYIILDTKHLKLFLCALCGLNNNLSIML